jgi:small subunit ribosomal protein S2
MAEEKLEEKLKKEDVKISGAQISVEEMAQAGLHLGHRTSKIHPKMKEYITGERNGVHMIDLEKTAVKLKEALNFIAKIVSEGKVLLLVGTKPQIKNMAKQIAIDCEIPYITERWLGGTFTNFATLKNRVNYFKDLEKKKESGELMKYTKKERADFDKEIKKLEIKFGGVKNVEKIPDAIFVLDMRKDDLAVREARNKNVAVIGIADTNIDPTIADIAIPANDDAISAVKYILEKLKETILKARPIK